MIRKILFLSMAVSAAAGSACSGMYGSAEAPPPAAQPMPVVVDGMRTSYADVVQKTSPAVVRIEASRKEKASRTQAPGGDDFFRQFQLPQGQDRRPQIERGVGSGVIVQADGTLLTNYHVIEGADKITVSMSDNKTYEAKIVGTDQPSDLALLKIDATNMPFVALGNSDNVRVGDIVLAIGNPLGIGQTVTAGIISAKGRRTGLSDGSFEDFLQTDAPINRGNSGGALVNLQGELIGINSQILSGGPSGGSIGIGFSIPSNMAKSVMEQLLKDGKVRRGMLGVGIQNLNEENAEGLELKDRSGVLVTEVKRDSAALKAGMKLDDVITAVNGEKVEDSNALRNRIAGTTPGTTVKLTIIRGGKELELSATLDEVKASDGTSPSPSNRDDDQPTHQEPSSKLGVTLEPLTPSVAKQLGIDADSGGMVVTDVDPNGPAAEEGVARGDVILTINRKPVNSLSDVTSVLSGSGGKGFLLLVSRRGQTAYLTVKPD